MQQDSSPSFEKKEEDAMQGSKPSLFGDPDPEFDEICSFKNSLQELKDLRSQLHYAADYCEMSFFKSKQKKKVIENTKEYICRAVVTVVDHLGSVSARLDCGIPNNEISNTEFRIDCLKQRLQTCQQHAHMLSLSKVRWSENLPIHHPRYISPIPNLEESNGVLRDFEDWASSKTITKYKLNPEGEMPLFLYTYAPKQSVARDLSSIYENSFKKLGSNSASGFDISTVKPASDGLPIQSKAQIPTFHFQANEQDRKVSFSNDFLSLLRIRSRTPIRRRGRNPNNSTGTSPRFAMRTR